MGLTVPAASTGLRPPGPPAQGESSKQTELKCPRRQLPPLLGLQGGGLEAFQILGLGLGKCTPPQWGSELHVLLSLRRAGSRITWGRERRLV